MMIAQRCLLEAVKTYRVEVRPLSGSCWVASAYGDPRCTTNFIWYIELLLYKSIWGIQLKGSVCASNRAVPGSNLETPKYLMDFERFK